MKETSMDRRLRRHLSEQREEVPAVVRRGIDDALARLEPAYSVPRRKRRSIRRLAAAIALTASIGGVAIWHAAPTSLAYAILPWIESIFAQFGDDGLREPNAASDKPEFVTERSDRGYALRIRETMFDGMRLSFSYSIEREDGIPTGELVIPDFQTGEAFGELGVQAMKFDSGRTVGDDGVGIVTYFVSEGLPESFELPLSVRQLGVHEGAGVPYRIVSGDWDLTAAFRREGDVQSRQWEPSLLHDAEDIRIELLSVRLSESATHWRFRLTQPLNESPFEADRTEVRYRFRFRQAADNDLAVIGSSTISGREMRTNETETTMYDLFTEPAEATRLVQFIPVRHTYVLEGGKVVDSSEREFPPLEVDLSK